MPTETVHWEVLEAFAKFGFDDGDGLIKTDVVVDALRVQGFECSAFGGLHNTWIGRVEGHGWGHDFDGYKMPTWDQLPLGFQQALKDIDPDMDEDFYDRTAADVGLDFD